MIPERASPLAVASSPCRWTLRGVAIATSVYLLLATTTGIGWLDSWHNEQRALQIALLAGMAVIGAHLQFARLQLRPGLSALVLVVLGLGAVSALFCDHPRNAFTEVALTLLLCHFAALVAAFAQSEEQSIARWVGLVCLFILAAHAVGGFTRYVAALETQVSLGTEVWILGFSNPRVASSFYALLIPYAALSTNADVERDRRVRAAAWVVLVAIEVVTAGLQSRAFWFSLAAALAAYAYLVRSNVARQLALTFVVTAAIGSAVQLALPMPEGDLSQSLARRDLLSSSGRADLWQLAVDTIRTAPLLGIGPGQYARLGAYAGAHPHNWILQLASEWGILALLVTLTGLAGLASRVRKTCDRRPGIEALRAASTLSLLIGLSSALVDGTLVMPSTQVAFFLSIGLLSGIMCWRGRPLKNKNPTKVILAAGLLVCATWLVVDANAMYQQQPAERAAFNRQYPGRLPLPRLWESGLLLLPDEIPIR